MLCHVPRRRVTQSLHGRPAFQLHCSSLLEAGGSGGSSAAVRMTGLQQCPAACQAMSCYCSNTTTCTKHRASGAFWQSSCNGMTAPQLLQQDCRIAFAGAVFVTACKASCCCMPCCLCLRRWAVLHCTQKVRGREAPAMLESMTHPMGL
jgi:hypothetical protein